MAKSLQRHPATQDALPVGLVKRRRPSQLVDRALDPVPGTGQRVGRRGARLLRWHLHGRAFIVSPFASFRSAVSDPFGEIATGGHEVGLSRTARTFIARSALRYGLLRSSTPLSSRPWWMNALSV